MADYHHETSNMFSIFYSHTTFNEKQLILSISLMHSIFVSGVIGMALWFKDPIFLCHTHLNSKELYKCTEFKACNNPYSFEIDTIDEPYTLTVILNLFCDRGIIKRMYLSIMFLGGLIGCLTNMISIKAIRRKNVIAQLGFLFSLSCFGIVIFTKYEIIVGGCLMLLSFSVLRGNAYCFMIINEYFTGNIASVSTVLMTLICGVLGIGYAFLAYIVNANSIILFSVMGSSCFINSVFLINYKNEKGVKEALAKMPSSTWQFITEIAKEKDIRINYLIYVFLWTCTSITFNDVLIEMENIGGNFYLNLMMVSIADTIASFLCGILILKFHIGQSIKQISNLLLLLFLSFILAPPNDEVANNNVYSIVFVIIYLIGKLLSAMTTNLIYLYGPKVLSDRFTPFFMLSVRFCSRVILLFLSHINHLFILYDLHSFLFLAFIWGIGRFSLFFSKEVTCEGIEDILNEFHISLTERVSIMTGRLIYNNGVSEILRNIEFGKFSLNVIRKSRLQKDIQMTERSHADFIRSKTMGHIDENIFLK